MRYVIGMVMVGAGLCMAGTATAGNDLSDNPFTKLVTGQSTQSSESPESGEQHTEQAKTSQDTPSHSQFGAAAETRERHHQPYPESAQNLGPQEEEQSQGSRGTTGGAKPRPGHEGKSQDAVSGAGH